MSRVIEGERVLCFLRLRGARLSRSTETTGAETLEIEGRLEMGIDVGMGFTGGQGWIGYDSSNSWWSQTLAACPVGKAVQHVEAARWGQYIDVISKFPAARTAGAGVSRAGRGQVLSISGQGTSRRTLTLGVGRCDRARETEIQSRLIDCQVPAAMMQRTQESESQRSQEKRATRCAGVLIVL